MFMIGADPCCSLLRMHDRFLDPGPVVSCRVVSNGLVRHLYILRGLDDSKKSGMECRKPLPIVSLRDMYSCLWKVGMYRTVLGTRIYVE